MDVRPGVALQLIDLVPDLEDSRFILPADPELRQHLFHVEGLRLCILMGNVAHVQDQVGLNDFLQGCPERRHQCGRQIGNEPHGIRKNNAQSAGQLDGAQSRIQRCKQHIGGKYGGLCQSVE